MDQVADRVLNPFARDKFRLRELTETAMVERMPKLFLPNNLTEQARRPAWYPHDMMPADRKQGAKAVSTYSFDTIIRKFLAYVCAQEKRKLKKIEADESGATTAPKRTRSNRSSPPTPSSTRFASQKLAKLHFEDSPRASRTLQAVDMTPPEMQDMLIHAIRVSESGSKLTLKTKNVDCGRVFCSEDPDDEDAGFETFKKIAKVEKEQERAYRPAPAEHGGDDNGEWIGALEREG